jgi:hypothetical protein
LLLVQVAVLMVLAVQQAVAAVEQVVLELAHRYQLAVVLNTQ